MEKLTSETLEMSYQASLWNTEEYICSQELLSGITHSREQDGPTTGECGPDRALASLSPRQAKEMGLLTSGTYGLRGSTLSSSADLASSLVSKYRAKTQCLGSTLFTLTWNVRYTPSRRPIFAARASGLRISDKDCTSWQSPNLTDSLGRAYTYPTADHNKPFPTLVGQAMLSGEPGNSKQEVKLTNWRSPSASDGEGGVMEIRTETAGKYKLRDEAELVSWATPSTRDYKDSGDLSKSQFRKDGKERNDTVPRQAQLTDSGNPPSGSIAATGNGGLSGQLNPGHSRWLMSLPPIWDVCGIRAADAIRSARSSKKAKAE